MARGVNKVTLIGNLGNDPEVRATTTGGSVARISVATTESWKDKQTGNREERTEWHRVVFFNRLAEIVAQYLKKGAKVYIEGSLRTSKWQDKDGSDRYTTEIIANEMQMLDSRTGDSSANPSYNAPASQPSNYSTAPTQSGNNTVTQQTKSNKFDDIETDDIPF